MFGIINYIFPVKLTPSWIQSSGKVIKVKLLKDAGGKLKGDVVVICESDLNSLSKKGIVEHA